MQNKQVRFVVLLGAFAIIGIISVQVYFLQKAWNIHEKQFTQTIFIGLKNVAEKMSQYTQTVLPHGNPVNQLSSNYFVVQVNSVIDANILEYYLKTEFEKLNIKTDFEYAIYDCHSEKMVYGNYISENGKGKPIKPTFNLPSYDEYVYYFGVNFPLMRNTIANDMTLWFFFSLILLVSVIFFMYAIFVILHQKRLSGMQKDFINNMTHEFKTPIASINISADVIIQPDIIKDPGRLITYGTVIKQENNRLNEQVEKVLQIAKIEKSGFHLKKETIALNELIKKVVNQNNANLSKDVTIETRLSPSVGDVDADLVHLMNIFHNLLDNAVKYSGDQPQITIDTSRTKRKVIVKISDNGPGIKPEYQKRIFQKFYRIPSGNIHDVKGFGLGLYYVKNICTAHKWNIRLESSPNEGATFILEIPDK